MKPSALTSQTLSATPEPKTKPKPGPPGATPMVRPTPLHPDSSDSLDTLEISIEHDENSVVAALESAAERASTASALTDSMKSKTSMASPNQSEYTVNDSLRKSHGSFSADSALDESTISPMER